MVNPLKGCSRRLRAAAILPSLRSRTAAPWSIREWREFLCSELVSPWHLREIFFWAFSTDDMAEVGQSVSHDFLTLTF